MITSRHDAAISGAPPAPGSRTRGEPYESPITVVLMFAEAVELRSREEADVDPARLEPVVEDLDDADDRVRGLGEDAVPDRERQDAGLAPSVPDS